MANERPEDIPSLAREMGTMLVGYVKQETLDPLRGLGRFLALGLAGMVVTGIGLVLLVLGGLRLLQTETGDAFRGHLSFLPYVCALAFCGIVAGGALKASKGSPKGGAKRKGGGR